MSDNRKVIVIIAQIECRMCPTIIIGRDENGSTIYARYRWGHLSVRLDTREPSPNGGAEGKWIYEQQLDPDGLEGFLTYDELREITAEFIEWPLEVKPRLYDDDGGIEWLDNI